MGTRIDRYVLRGVLGRGASGSVYAALDTKMEREVALKLVAHAKDKKTRERFHREVRAIVSLGHQNIVEIYDYSGPDSEQLYYVMEKLDGDDLYNLFHRRGPLPEPAAAAVGYELCSALAVMHEAGMIHRDLKPENVFVTTRGRTVLTDFGVVKAVRGNSTIGDFETKTEVVGTPGFMAPEQLANKVLGPYTDVFALGALLYNVVTGELPFQAASPLGIYHLIKSGELIDPAEYVPDLSQAFGRCLKQCLMPRPKERFQSALEVRALLTEVLDTYHASDLRDELAAFIRNPTRYAEKARQEASLRLRRELDTALARQDEAEAKRAQRQLARVGVSTGVHEVSELTKRSRLRRGLRGLFVAGAALAGAILVLVLASPERRAALVAQLSSVLN